MAWVGGIADNKDRPLGSVVEASSLEGYLSNFAANVGFEFVVVAKCFAMEFECSIVVDKYYKVQNMMKKDIGTYLGLLAAMVSLVQLEKKVLQPPYLLYIWL